jgi:hypothetical protein
LTRNPLYVANLTIAAGILLASNRWPLLGAVPLGFAYYTLVAIAEEDFLKNAFPDRWQDYFCAVPRFLPRLRKPLPTETRFRILECITPEMSTIIAFELALGLIGLRLYMDYFSVGGTEFPLF